jgi:primary-amine oxidase
LGVASVALGPTIALAVTLGAQSAAPVPARHPLDPLSTAEIRVAVDLVRARPDVPRDVLFPVIALNEPAKEEVRAYRPGTAAGPREAMLVVLDRPKNQSFEAVVDLRAKSIKSYTPIRSGQPLITDVEMEIVRDVVRRDPAWQAAMKARNISNLDHVMIDPWAPGFLDPKTEPAGRRYVRALSYMRDTNRNGYARPIEGVVALVDLGAAKVERVLDTGVRPIPPATDLPAAAGARRAAASVAIPGVSTTGDIKWNNWRFRVSVHPREGLVLHTVGWQDGTRLRSVLYRASLSEMLVPYADPERTWSFRNAFDAGEYGIGRLTTEMTPGSDAPATAMFLPAVFADDHGVPSTRARAVAVYERDGGVLWKHYQFDDNPAGREGGTNYSRRARELVVSWIATVGNYDYGLNWIFKEDGSLELEAFLTGIMLAKGVAAKTESDHAAMNGGTDGKYWHLVGANVAAPHHQHFFNFRLDFDVDGSAPNAVREMNVRAEPGGGDNPDGNAFLMEATALREERDARRDLDLTRSRKWLVINPESRNALGQPVGFLLAPGENSVPYLQPSSNIRQRAAFIDHPFWATQYHASEMHAAGDYPNQSSPGDGLPRWTAPNRPLEGRDVVIWYTFGVTHVPRPEDWPVMTSHKTGFKLLPVSFFARNPAVR